MAADKFLNLTAVQTIKTWATGLFSTKAELQALDDRVDEIVAEGGEPNVIESISVNGTPVAPDAQKNVALTMPTATSDLTNDGDGTSNFATEAYVAQNGGKIDSISVNGTAQTIDANKNVDLSVQEFNIITYGVTTYSELQTMYQNKKPTFIRLASAYLPVHSIDINEQDALFIIHIPVVTSADGNMLATVIIMLSSNNGWSMMPFNKSIPTAVSDLTNDSGYQTASDVQSAIASGVASAVKIKGSVATYADLPATGNQNGDMYDTLDTGKNYVWIYDESTQTGRWDDYAGTMDLSAYWTSTPNQTNSLEAATVAEINAILNA